jgi:ElaB/YqjD/DUF883 family membrane-anchored ribosome-binding protein
MSSTMRDDFRHDSNKPPRELEREIDATRAHMEKTLALLETKLSPGEWIDQALQLARRNGGEFTHNLSSQIQNNPLPTLLASVGLVWLMSSANQPPPGPYSYSASGRARGGMRSTLDSTREAGRHLREGAHDLGDRTRQMGDRAMHAAHDVGERTRQMGDRAMHAAHEAGERVHEMTDSARERMRRARAYARRSGYAVRDRYEHMLHDQPLLIGGLGLAFGAALGAMLPRTRTEDELLGEYSDEVKQRVKEEGREYYEQGRETVERAVHAAESAVEKEISKDQEKSPGQSSPSEGGIR